MTSVLRVPPATTDRSRETRERLLDAAERLFAERGFEGTTLRAVTRAANASVSAANYHFGTKRALLHETLLRRVEPINRARAARLDALERAGAPGLPAVLEAFLRPVFEARAESAAPVRQVAARLYADPPWLVAELKRELFGPIQDRFVGAIARNFPDAAGADLDHAFQFTVGVMVHMIGGHLDEFVGADAESKTAGNEALLARMLQYAEAGIRASLEHTP